MNGISVVVVIVIIIITSVVIIIITIDVSLYITIRYNIMSIRVDGSMLVIRFTYFTNIRVTTTLVTTSTTRDGR